MGSPRGLSKEWSSREPPDESSSDSPLDDPASRAAPPSFNPGHTTHAAPVADLRRWRRCMPRPRLQRVELLRLQTSCGLHTSGKQRLLAAGLRLWRQRPGRRPKGTEVLRTAELRWSLDCARGVSSDQRSRIWNPVRDVETKAGTCPRPDDTTGVWLGDDDAKHRRSDTSQGKRTKEKTRGTSGIALVLARLSRGNERPCRCCCDRHGGRRVHVGRRMCDTILGASGGHLEGAL